MTREEAINMIKALIGTYITCHGEEDTIAVPLDNIDIEAFDMAIKVLKQKPCEDGFLKEWLESVPTEDVVEREKIDDIKAEIDKLTVYHTTEKGSELISKKAVYRAINFVLTGSRDIDI